MLGTHGEALQPRSMGAKGAVISRRTLGTALSVAAPRMASAPDLARHWEQHMQLHSLPHTTPGF